MTRPRRTRIAAAALALLAGPAFAAGDAATPPETVPPNAPVFVEQAAAAGIDNVYDGPWEFFVGGGAADFDCDGDRRPDLFLAGGAGPARLYRNRSRTGGPLRFEERRLDLPAGGAENVLGAYPLDIDNDGFTDLALIRLGRNLLLKGGPDCGFEVANRAWGFDGGREWTTAFAATWEAGADFPTLAFGNYVDRSAPGSPWGTCADNALFRPVPGERPDYAEETPLAPGYCALSMLFTDWSRSGEPALRVTNDRQYNLDGQEQLWRVSPGRPPRQYTAAEGWARLKIWGMGIAEADIDADGFPDYALTSMGDTKLQALDPEAAEGRPAYRDLAYERGATAHRPYVGGDLRPSTGWHAEFADFDNDGRQDLFIAKGNVEEMPDFAAFDPDNLLLGGADGRFTEVGAAAGIALNRRGRGAAIADFNLDGLLDLVVANRGGPASVFRNLGRRGPAGPAPQGNWLALELRQPGANRNAVGARVSVRLGRDAISRTVQVGGGHASGSAGWTHLGLGVADRVEVRVQWPDGEWSRPYRVLANQFAILERGAPEIAYWSPE